MATLAGFFLVLGGVLVIRYGDRKARRRAAASGKGIETELHSVAVVKWAVGIMLLSLALYLLLH